MQIKSYSTIQESNNIGKKVNWKEMSQNVKTRYKSKNYSSQDSF